MSSCRTVGLDLDLAFASPRSVSEDGDLKLGRWQFSPRQQRTVQSLRLLAVLGQYTPFAVEMSRAVGTRVTLRASSIGGTVDGKTDSPAVSLPPLTESRWRVPVRCRASWPCNWDKSPGSESLTCSRP